MSEDVELEWLDPESEVCFGSMASIVKREVSVRILLQDDDVHDPAWVDSIASLVADALLNRLVGHLSWF